LVDALCCCRSKFCLQFEEQNTDLSGESDLSSKLLRICVAAGVTGYYHTLHLDRGYGEWKTAVDLEAVQVLVNMNIPFNRVGIPRRAIAMAQQLIDDSASPKWAWVVFSKGVYELLVWNDGSVVYWFGNSCRAKPRRKSRTPIASSFRLARSQRRVAVCCTLLRTMIQSIKLPPYLA
jgi:hypothetical protein